MSISSIIYDTTVRGIWNPQLDFTTNNEKEFSIEQLIQKSKIDAKANYTLYSVASAGLYFLSSPFTAAGVFVNAATSIVNLYRYFKYHEDKYWDGAVTSSINASKDLALCAAWSISYLSLFRVIKFSGIVKYACNIFLLINYAALSSPNSFLSNPLEITTKAIFGARKITPHQTTEFKNRFLEALKNTTSLKPTDYGAFQSETLKDFFTALRNAKSSLDVLEAFNQCPWDEIDNATYKKRLEDYKIIAIYHFTNPKLIIEQSSSYDITLQNKYDYANNSYAFGST